MVRTLAPAKVNLLLKILARDDSGYHQLETVFLAIQLGDTLSLARRNSGITLRVDGPPLGPLEENLVYRAARGFLDLARRDAGVEIRLEKHLPVRGGLGGGSSDAAATLRAMSLLLPGWVEWPELQELAAGLGSDVPFFLSCSPLAMAWGRGERLMSLPPLPAAPVVLALPPFGISTPEAYRLLDLDRMGHPGSPRPAFHTPGTLGSWDEVAGWAENDFEGVLFREFPLLQRIRRKMQEGGARISLLSGSGSALFALFAREEEARGTVSVMEKAFPETRFILSRTLEEFPDPILEPGVES
ncbi:MAG: 4-(cytidine 5'-diphospho)-2-C-methyl-D-erythritol kinase [Gemmatimonadota bacterium]|jgi:4-diphosphocytidyl-2-C-methyl-D-erythritol kinase